MKLLLISTLLGTFCLSCLVGCEAEQGPSAPSAPAGVKAESAPTAKPGKKDTRQVGDSL